MVQYLRTGTKTQCGRRRGRGEGGVTAGMRKEERTRSRWSGGGVTHEQEYAIGLDWGTMEEVSTAKHSMYTDNRCVKMQLGRGREE